MVSGGEREELRKNRDRGGARGRGENQALYNCGLVLCILLSFLHNTALEVTLRISPYCLKARISEYEVDLLGAWSGIIANIDFGTMVQGLRQ